MSFKIFLFFYFYIFSISKIKIFWFHLINLNFISKLTLYKIFPIIISSRWNFSTKNNFPNTYF